MANIRAAADKWSPRLLSVLRIVAALCFMAHGLMKIFHFPQAMMPGALPPLLMVAGWIEIVGGGLLILGLFTRPVAFLLSGEMAIAYFMFHFPKGFYPVLNGGESAVLFCFVFLYLAAAGGGAWSVDAFLNRTRPLSVS